MAHKPNSDKLNRGGRLNKTADFSIKEWLGATDHKQRVGILYIITAVFFLCIAGSFGETYAHATGSSRQPVHGPVPLHSNNYAAWPLDDSVGLVAAGRRFSKLHCAVADRCKRPGVFHA